MGRIPVEARFGTGGIEEWNGPGAGKQRDNQPEWLVEQLRAAMLNKSPPGRNLLAAVDSTEANFFLESAIYG
jgi:hypothetical protein